MPNKSDDEWSTTGLFYGLSPVDTEPLRHRRSARLTGKMNFLILIFLSLNSVKAFGDNSIVIVQFPGPVPKQFE